MRVSQRLKPIYTLEGKTWQHDTRKASKTPHAATIYDNYQRVGPGPTSP
jgi:hypothetical protein